MPRWFELNQSSVVSKASPLSKDLKIIVLVNIVVILFVLLSGLLGLSVFHAAVGS